MFKKRHYEAIARLLKAQYTRPSTKSLPPTQDFVIDRVVDDMVAMFEDDNPRFKREKFLKAAGYERR